MLPRHAYTVVASVVALIVGGPEGVVAQHSLPLMSVDFDLAHYGIGAPEELRRGQVSVAYAPEGPRLGVYSLRSTGTRVRVTYPEPPPTPTPVVGALPPTRQTALWVWNTEELIADPHERSVFLDFIEARGISRVFLYLAPAKGTRASAGFIPFASEEMGPLLADLRARGALAYALDGDRDYVREENHPGVLRTVARLVEHNRNVPEEQRFHGVRYDIEPYLAPGFQGPDRSMLLQGYVDLIAGVSQIARDGDLAVAVDIPFWFDAPNEETGDYLEAELNGRRGRVLEHLMSLVDDMAIMDYRTSAQGPNGALAHAYHELAMGGERGVEIYVGVETTRLLDEDLHTFFGPAREGLPSRGDARWLVFEHAEDDRTRLWLVDSDEALAELAERTHNARLLRHWSAGRPARVSADAQSFFNLGADRMRAVTEEVIRHLSGEPAFVGLAYHDYRGLRELLSRN